MRGHISQIRKIAQKRGTGELGNYIPWIFISELNSQGTCESYPDPIHGRAVQLLSQGEFRAYLKMRFSEFVYDIREQFPLMDIERAFQISREAGFRYPIVDGNKGVMTTDLLIIKTDGTKVACSCKPNIYGLSVRDKEKLYIESRYWLDIGVDYSLVETDRISKTLAMNIRNAFEYYDKKAIHDKASEAKHLVATKQVIVDMEKPINWVTLAKELGL